MSDLLPRVAVAVVGVPAVLAALYFGGWYLSAPVAFFAAMGAREVYRMSNTRGIQAFPVTGMAAAAGFVVVAHFRPDFVLMAPLVLAIVAALAWLSLVLALWTRGPKRSPLSVVSITVFGAVYAGLSLTFALLLHAMPQSLGWGSLTSPSPWMGAAVVALPVASTWIGDAAAYFAGTAWGKRKLFPSVSPAKSWVGAWAGLIGAAVAAVAWYFLTRDILPRFPVEGPAQAAAMGAALGVGAQVGDLIESMLKREAGVKDSGSIFPGHGGVLDRLDALIFTLPMAYLLLLWVG